MEFWRAKKFAVNQLPLNHGLAVEMQPSNRKPGNKALVTRLLDLKVPTINFSLYLNNILLLNLNVHQNNLYSLFFSLGSGIKTLGNYSSYDITSNPTSQSTGWSKLRTWWNIPYYMKFLRHVNFTILQCAYFTILKFCDFAKFLYFESL